MDTSTLVRRMVAALPAAWVLALLVCGPGFVFAEEDRFGGIGLQVVPTAGGELVVLQVVQGSPAASEGLRPGDFIFRVDDQTLAGSVFEDVVTDLLWGRVGTQVTLGYMRPGEPGERTITLRRVPLESAPGSTPGVHMLTPKEPRESLRPGS